MTTPQDEFEALLREAAGVGGREAWGTGEEMPLVERARAILAAAESRGYERAREQAAGIADDRVARCQQRKPCDACTEATALAGLIRAMTDERARGEEAACAGCAHPRWNHRKGPCGVFVMSEGTSCPCSGFVDAGDEL